MLDFAFTGSPLLPLGILSSGVWKGTTVDESIGICKEFSAVVWVTWSYDR